MKFEFNSSTTTSLDFNKGLPLKEIFGNVGFGIVGFGSIASAKSYNGLFQLTTYDYSYDFFGLRYRTGFSTLDKTKGKIRRLDLKAFEDKPSPYHQNEVGYNLCVSITELNTNPQSFYKLMKKGDKKATEKLLKGDDTFDLTEVMTSQTVNGFKGNDTFDLLNYTSRSSGNNVDGGKGNDYFKFKNENDILTGGTGKDIFHYWDNSFEEGQFKH